MEGFKDLKQKNGRFVIEYEKIKDKMFLTNFNYDKERFNFYYVNDNGKRIYFKGNGRHSFDIPELFCAQIAKKIGMDFIDPYPAVFLDEFGDEIEGIISEDYVKDRENTTIISGRNLKYNYIPTNTVTGHFVGACIYTNEIKNKFGKAVEVANDLLDQLKIQALFYFMTMQEDCYVYNFNYYIKDNIFNLDVIADNSYSLLLNTGTARFLNDNSNFDQEEYFKDLEETIKSYKTPFNLEDNNLSNKQTFEVFAKEILKNPVLKEFYNKLRQINLNQLLTEYKKQNPELNIQNIHIKQADFVFEHQKKEMQREIRRQILNSKAKKQVKEKELSL